MPVLLWRHTPGRVCSRCVGGRGLCIGSLACGIAGGGQRGTAFELRARPILASVPDYTDHSAIPEVVENELNGLLVPPANEIALADALEKIIADPEYGRNLGSRGREIVVEKFDPITNSRILLEKFSE